MKLKIIAILSIGLMQGVCNADDNSYHFDGVKYDGIGGRYEDQFVPNKNKIEPYFFEQCSIDIRNRVPPIGDMTILQFLMNSSSPTAATFEEIQPYISSVPSDAAPTYFAPSFSNERAVTIQPDLANGTWLVRITDMRVRPGQNGITGTQVVVTFSYGTITQYEVRFLTDASNRDQLTHPTRKRPMQRMQDVTDKNHITDYYLHYRCIPRPIA